MAAVVPCPSPGASTDNIGGATMDMASQHVDLDSGSMPAHGIDCPGGCGGSGLLGGGPQPGSLSASGTPPDLVLPVG